ncbi:hypothetical protein [Streptomyces shenzhenensis]|uniref:hypothetical protein n=1 Tax=Streptomyces shenzhenensis TaxID=943815 RepID=UPI001F1F9542|nr:hypothetical protein [Streptomyces shenzhenensis]
MGFADDHPIPPAGSGPRNRASTGGPLPTGHSAEQVRALATHSQKLIQGAADMNP